MWPALGPRRRITIEVTPEFRDSQKPPNEKLNVAGIGVGGMGANNVKACSDENIVALCDVDSNYAAKVFAAYPKAKVHRDFRQT